MNIRKEHLLVFVKMKDWNGVNHTQRSLTVYLVFLHIMLKNQVVNNKMMSLEVVAETRDCGKQLWKENYDISLRTGHQIMTKQTKAAK